MSSDVTLSAAIRTNLLALQGTQDLVNRTQQRLSTGLKVNSPVDDPVAYFQSQSLTDRAGDFTQTMQGINQGVSTLTAATDAVSGVESLVQQLKGLVLNAKSATTSTEIANTITQFGTLRNQIGYLAADAQYQGLNLVNGTGQQLSVDFSNATASVLTVNSVDITAGSEGLAIGNLVSADSSGTGVNINFASSGALTLSAGDSLTVTIGGSSQQAWTAGTYSFSYGGKTLTLSVGSTTSAKLYSGQSFTVGTVLTLAIASTNSAGAIKATNNAAGNVAITSDVTGQTVATVNATAGMDTLINNLDSALITLRSRAQVLGSNVALLQTRLDFTQNYVNTLTAGAGQLNLADTNTEGANMLALQTRQQLGISALSMAGQSQQAVLKLFG